MLAKRIIPCLDIDGGKVVKGRMFDDLVVAGDPVELAMNYRDQGADELVLLDISATIQGRKTMVELVKRVAGVLDIPFTVGGGIRNLDDARAVLWNGADKVSVNTASVKNPEIITSLADVYGAQSVVASIDARKAKNGGYEVYVEGGRTATGLDAIQWAMRTTGLGAGEILLTSIDMDGTEKGYDMDLTSKVSGSVAVPVIASGGGGSPDHIYRVLTEGLADAALAASIFHFNQYSIAKVKEYLKERGVPVRI
ncbi:MAG: imidazole glycerol phosphate synthase subunit HisF [Nitrososphaerota archaeon]|jgi:cyclase|nr:imidazole glycerol phosphate synthase subunit HisF [Nitrososphaerota archaeon]MDG6932886.1 imidazole glycerol phosphate synthase subunit HisF [Nitrososphaerota archaeon]MDG6936685.1 imidazole glycerol phosphate synthase subunit HisF [Nitrososphaerota archaeon]MDG6943531.1 imidazole glycerol phosphate synthase subunit HisF [Nitrososphaerota archaeon]